MCEIIERNRAEAYAEGEAHGEARGEAHGEARGMARGMLTTLINLLKKNRITVEEAAEDANMTVTAFKAEMAAFL